MDWDALDYLAALFLLGGGLAAYLAARRLIANARLRGFAGLAIIASVALIWAQLAVGLF